MTPRRGWLAATGRGLFLTISWNEPWFFVIRLREAGGWRRRLLLAMGISVVMLFTQLVEAVSHLSRGMQQRDG